MQPGAVSEATLPRCFQLDSLFPFSSTYHWRSILLLNRKEMLTPESEKETIAGVNIQRGRGSV